MHSLVRRFIKTAIAFLSTGLAIGGWILTRREISGRFPTPYQVSAHTHALFVGFVMMMILGVALWMFPRAATGDTRYRPSRIEIAYWLLTAGTTVRVAGELLRQSESATWLRWAVTLSGFSQIVGLCLFFHTMWPRIRAAGSRQREEEGERF